MNILWVKPDSESQVPIPASALPGHLQTHKSLDATWHLLNERPRGWGPEFQALPSPLGDSDASKVGSHSFKPLLVRFLLFFQLEGCLMNISNGIKSQWSVTCLLFITQNFSSNNTYHTVTGSQVNHSAHKTSEKMHICIVSQKAYSQKAPYSLLSPMLLNDVCVHRTKSEQLINILVFSGWNCLFSVMFVLDPIPNKADLNHIFWTSQPL